jgi:hypothetical protein
MIRKCIFPAVVFFFSALLSAGTNCFIEIPGIKGDPDENRPAQFKNYFQPLSLQYRLPGVPLPPRLQDEAPKRNSGFLGGDDLKHKYISFSKLVGQSDNQLIDIYNKKKTFDQWKIFVCSDKGNILMTFIFKGVTVIKVTKRDKKQYITAQFKRVMWNYQPPRQ